MTRIAMISFLVALAALLTPAAHAAEIFHYQGRLTTREGISVDGSIDVGVWIYDSPTHGVSGALGDPHLLYAESHAEVSVERGMLRLSIGEGDAMGAFAGKPLPVNALAEAADLYLVLYVDGERVDPRQHIGYRNAAWIAERAAMADRLAEAPHITAANLPDDMSASMTHATSLLSVGRLPAMSPQRIAEGPPYFDASLLPLLPLNLINGTTRLDSGRIGQIDSASIAAGVFAEEQIPAQVLAYDQSGSSSFHMQSGAVSDGTALSIPPQFTEDECGWVAGLASFTGHIVEPPDMHCGTTIDALNISIDAPSNGFTVHCTYSYYCWEGVGSDVSYYVEQPCVADTLVVCAKNG